MTTSADVVNRAFEIMGNQIQVTGTPPNFDSTAAGKAAGVLYAPTVNLLLRRNNPDFARTRILLVLTAPPGGVMPPWLYEYNYPTDCLRARQVRPPQDQAGALADANDPRPVRAAVAIDLNALGQNMPAKVILTNQQNAALMYTTSTAGVGNETMWDSIFVEGVAYLLGSPLAMALAGRPDYSKELLDEAQVFSQMGELSEDF